MDVHPLKSATARTAGEGQRETAHTTDLSLRAAAAVAGLGLLVMAVLAGLSFAAFESLVVPADAATTARNIVDHELLFRSLICGFLIVVVLDVVVAWALYVFLGPAGRSLALLAAWFRVVYAAVFAAALSNLFVAVRLPAGAYSLQAFTTGQSNAQVMVSVNAFNDGWDAALVLFGLHLLLLGYLIFKSGYVSRAIGILVMVASAGYLIDSFGGFLSAGYDANIAVFTFFGEVVLMGWLLWKAVRPGKLLLRAERGAGSHG